MYIFIIYYLLFFIFIYKLQISIYIFLMMTIIQYKTI